ncbi:MAG: IclR family transcriptional regulator [Pseudomonadota bacterium]
MPKSNPLDRAFKVLDIVASSNREVTLVEVVQISGLPQSSTFRLLTHLVESGMLRFDKGNKSYGVGARANRLSLFISGRRTLEAAVVPVLEMVARESGETAFFVTASEHGNRLLDFVVPELGATSFIHPGFEFPIHATAAGKVIHAFASDQNIDVPDDYDLSAFQPGTITDRDRLRETFLKVRSDGYAINDSELDDDVFSACVPVFFKDTLAGALGVVGPKARMQKAGSVGLTEMVRLLSTNASEISSLLERSDGFGVSSAREQALA